MEKYNNRNEVPSKYKWDLNDYFKSDEDFLKTLEETSKEISILLQYKNKLKDSNQLYEYIIKNIEISNKVVDIYIYAQLRVDEDLSDSNTKEFLGKSEELYTNYLITNSFFQPELLELTKDEYEELFKNKKLDKYKIYLDHIYKYKEHVLDSEKEAIVSTLLSTSDSYMNMSSSLLNSCHDYGNIIMDNGEEEKVMSTNYRSLMKKLSREKREKLYNQFNKVKEQYADISASLLDSYVKTNKNIAQIYKFNSCWEQKLFGLELTDKVFDTLIQTCYENKSVLKKYWDLKADVLKIDSVKPWDRATELYETKKEYTIEEAQNLILNALQPLGDIYIKQFRNLIDERCVDYCQYKGKCSGGYNVSASDKINSKVLMSYLGNLDCVSTLAHEGGHFTNHRFIFENNDIIYRENSTIVAEVASLTNECLLSYYLAKSNNKDEALAGLSNIISVVENNLFGAVQEGSFEKMMYEYVENGGTLTKDYLCNLNEESIKKFYPVEKLDSKYEKIEWISRSHFYMFFYLFSYAISISVAMFISKEIFNGNKEVLNKYYEFLKTGDDKTIVETFAILGIDLEDKKVYENAIQMLDELLNEFKKIYKEEYK